jgi:broad specificity phosphatase PhoE
MSATKIMLIRHAEKPDGTKQVQGVTHAGTPDSEDLSVAGWQRAGALVRLFAPRGAFVDPHLASPDAIFAAGIGHHSPSARPQHTVQPLANFLRKPINLDHLKGHETGLAQAALATDGVVLIAWEHEAIPAIANAIVGNATTTPQVWPDERFDLVWVLDRTGDGWSFQQVAQLLLADDQPA